MSNLVAVLTIRVFDDKPPEVTGPVHDKIACYGLLLLAFEILLKAPPPEPKMVKPVIMPPFNIKEVPHE